MTYFRFCGKIMTDKTKGRDTMRVGYVRCSTIEQNEARQLKMMEEQKAEKLFIDKVYASKTELALKEYK